MKRPDIKKLEERLLWQVRLAENIDQYNDPKLYFFIERRPTYDALRITSIPKPKQYGRPTAAGVCTRIIYDPKEFGYKQRAPMLRHIEEYLIERDVSKDERMTKKFDHVTLNGRLRQSA